MNSKILLWGFFANIVVVFVLGMFKPLPTTALQGSKSLAVLLRQWWEKNPHV